MPVRRTILLGVLSLVISVTNVCHAEGSTSTAAELFEAASAASARGDHVAAATAFEQAYRVAPRGATAFNAAVSWEAARQPERAADAYARALQHDDLAPDARQSAQARLIALGAVLGHVVILGVRLTRTISLTAGEVFNLDLRPSVAPAPPPNPRPAHSREPTEARPPNPWRTAGFVALGAAVALAGTATYLGISALDARDEFVDSGETSRSAHDRAASLRTWTNVAWAGAGIMATTAGILIFVVPTHHDAQGPRTRWHAGIGWSGKF
jgi:tetratricopeptide (TPR) repeat protein